MRAGSRFLADLMDTKVWAVSILDAEGEPLARSCALDRDTRQEDVTRMPARPGPLTGALLVEGAGGWLECSYRDHLRIGDHVLVIGEVLGAHPAENYDPLIFVRGRFHTLGETA
jgi:flavin reductase (DIM6/NTAB) family NADH-FMN oxidoreductase RutF